MRYLIPLIVLFALTGCGERQITDAEVKAELRTAGAQKTEAEKAELARALVAEQDKARDKAVAQVSANLTPIADAVEIKGQPGLANATRDQKKALDGTISLPASELPAATLTLKGLLENAEAERVKAMEKANALQLELERKSNAVAQAEKERQAAAAEAEAARKLAAEEKAKADAEAAQAWWLKAGGTALAVVTALAGLAARLGLPGGQLATMAVDIVSPMLKRDQKVADAAIAASDVGRSALSVLDSAVAADPELAARLSLKVAELTKGRADTVEDLFKLAAKAHVVDAGKGVAHEVDKKLTAMRDAHIETEGGMPAMLGSLLNMAAIVRKA